MVNTQINRHTSSVTVLLLFYFTLIPARPKVPAKIAEFDFGKDPSNFGESASVQCLVTSGDFPVSFAWLFNGREINENVYDVSMVKLGKKISALSIDFVRDHHAGNYTCVAVNRATSVNYTAELVVNGTKHQLIVFLRFLFYSYLFYYLQPYPTSQYPQKLHTLTSAIMPSTLRSRFRLIVSFIWVICPWTSRGCSTGPTYRPTRESPSSRVARRRAS